MHKPHRRNGMRVRTGHCRKMGTRLNCKHEDKWTDKAMERFLLDSPTQATHDLAIDSVYINDEDVAYVYLRGNDILCDGVPLDDYNPLVQDPADLEDGGESAATAPAVDIPPSAAPASRDVVMGTVGTVGNTSRLPAMDDCSRHKWWLGCRANASFRSHIHDEELAMLCTGAHRW